MKKSVKLVDDTHRFAGFAVLNAPDIPSALLEMGYLSNKEEENLLKQASYRKKLATSAANAIDNIKCFGPLASAGGKRIDSRLSVGLASAAWREL